MWGLQPGELEERQCLLLHPAAGVLVWERSAQDADKPTLTEVQGLAQRMREQLWDHAAAAAGELGDPAPWIGAKEHEIRGYIHDCLHSHHDKDYRLYHVFPVKELQDYTMQFWRVNYLGQYQVDHIVGSNVGAEEKVIPFLIHGGHIRLLSPKDKDAGLELAREITLPGQPGNQKFLVSPILGMKIGFTKNQKWKTNFSWTFHFMNCCGENLVFRCIPAYKLVFRCVPAYKLVFRCIPASGFSRGYPGWVHVHVFWFSVFDLVFCFVVSFSFFWFSVFWCSVVAR